MCVCIGAMALFGILPNGRVVEYANVLWQRCYENVNFEFLIWYSVVLSNVFIENVGRIQFSETNCFPNISYK